MGEQEARQLVMEAIAAGIDNDLGSGSNIDLCVIRADRALDHLRGVWKDPGLPSDNGIGEQGVDGECNPPHRLRPSEDTGPYLASWTHVCNSNHIAILGVSEMLIVGEGSHSSNKMRLETCPQAFRIF